MSTLTYTPAIIPAVLPRTLDQVRSAIRAELGTKGIPNAHWPLSTGADCLGLLTYAAGIRPREDLANPLISISAFRASSGWHEVRGTADLRPGDWPLWDWDGDGFPDHASFLYSLNRAHDEIITDEANTGPHVGDDIDKHPNLRGVWQKTRPLSESALWGAIRPPYAPVVSTSKERKQVLTAATYLDKVMPASIRDEATGRTIILHRSDAGSHGSVRGDGLRGPLYRRLVQAWGRLHGIYGLTYRIDDVFGPRSEYVEKRLFTQLRVA
jgi:hypothetical protein